MADKSANLCPDVASSDFLTFKFGPRGYADQLTAAVAKTGEVAAITCKARTLASGIKVMWIEHNFAFLGGSLGCAEGERITQGFEHATSANLPVVLLCISGGARMQEGVLSLMQMAKVSVAVESHRRAGLPFVSVLQDPTYGGVSASYAMQADVKIAVAKARIGFAGPDVILNTMCDQKQDVYDATCPERFQSAEFVQEKGGVDIVVAAEPTADGAPPTAKATADAVENVLGRVLAVLHGSDSPASVVKAAAVAPNTAEPDYTRSRDIARPQAQDMMSTIFSDFVELKGDGKTSTDPCIRGGLARIGGRRCVVLGTTKGHTLKDMQAANYGMPSPAGYRTALRLFKLAEIFRIPVVTLVDTVGAWPSFSAEEAGQSEAIATNLTAMASLKTPIVTLIIGEGGSGGALGIAMGDRIGMLEGAYYGVISPEGAASILGRYNDPEHKKQQFPIDCRALATGQGIYAHQLLRLGVVDEVIPETTGESFNAFPLLTARITAFVSGALAELIPMSNDALVASRYSKFRGMGVFDKLDESQRVEVVRKSLLNAQPSAQGRARRGGGYSGPVCGTLLKLAELTLHGENSVFRGLVPGGKLPVPPPPLVPTQPRPSTKNAKAILDEEGPEAMAAWVRAQSKSRVLITDTTMRDAHQSLLATRVRTTDILTAAAEASTVLHDAFSFECWGGATFDVAYRFLDESPWERLRNIRKAIPNVCTQMLIRGANGVGYTSYPDNVIENFVALAAQNGMDVFRIFDCFNDVSNMQVAIQAVRKARKVAEVAVCYTGDILTSDLYTPAYYTDVCKRAREAGAHMIAIKDMAGLLKPNGAKAIMAAIRAGAADLPIHFHTHATSSASLATALAMVENGCDIIDLATASLADATSQPSLNAFCASLVGHARDPKIDYLKLEPLDMHWAKLRELYAPFECGMKSGSARVFDHEIPGGQYTNLLVQCRSMGLMARWEEVLDTYRDVNALLGNVVKVTPSSKSIGDFALYLINKKMKASEVVAKAPEMDFPQSVFELLEGRLGFPHTGFPKEVSDAILKGAKPLPMGERSSATLKPADFAAEKARLEATHGGVFTDEDVNSSILYPKVFEDYVKGQAKYGAVLTYLTSPAYFHGLGVNDTVAFSLPTALAAAEFGPLLGASESELSTAAASDATVECRISLVRVGPKMHGSMRTLEFTVSIGKWSGTQEVALKDADGEVEFTGPMANAKDKAQLGSPMPGVVEKVHVKTGAAVNEGDVLFTVCAMKMEVHVKAPYRATVGKLIVNAGDRVVEGALLGSFKAQPAHIS